MVLHSEAIHGNVPMKEIEKYILKYQNTMTILILFLPLCTMMYFLGIMLH